ncbi:hypothetical protein AVEN_184114-1 [Araneus ventricosus]|uniref:Uncharacterized protein n=1 Tax=Araneus ventricosus TaxID=182803 RepID=A0A4Y2D0C1_ARAVE|nr:hypothetical protein AVEN_184114-1 [Araneus ventricosus]
MGRKPMNPDFGNKFDDNFSDIFCDFGGKIKVPENTRIVTLSQLGMELWRFYWNFPCDVTPCRKDYKNRADNEGRDLFGVLFTLRVSQLLDAERFCSCCCCYYW